VRIRFGPFAADLDTRQLTRDGREVHLVPKAFELLVTLVRERPKVLSKSFLLERLWPDTYVSEGNLSNLIADIRQALGDRASAPVFIRTAHGYGYAFCGDATTEPGGHDGASDRAPCWLEWGTRRFRLSVGQHIIGRDADAEIRLDESTVSRHHARLIVTDVRTLLEDLGSKNGTRHAESWVTLPIELADGDAIRIGSLLLTFHTRAASRSTVTQAEGTP
jgi:DNA-binding winged helix-turn-helix (wHTH) protein